MTASPAESLFQAENLPFPPVPAALVAGLLPCGPTVFATRTFDDSPYHLDRFLHEAERGMAMADYALVGFDGHGINSWAVHYYLVCGALALFIQLPWGGAYSSTESARREIAHLLEWAALMQRQVQEAQAQRRIPQGWRLVIVVSRYTVSGWRWQAPDEVRGQSRAWNPPDGMTVRITQVLAGVLAGRLMAGDTDDGVNAG